MAIDYSKYSDEELFQMLNGGGGVSTKTPTSSYSPSSRGFGESFLRGAGQSIGDTAASAINWPIQGIEKLTGKQFGRAPHPQLINENPESMSENLGQLLGGLAGGFAIPGGAAVKGAQLANKGYQLLKGGKELGILGKTLAGTSAGALEGAAGYEPNRGLGAAFGGTVGGASTGIPAVYNFAKSIKSKNIIKNVKDKVNELKIDYNNRFSSPLNKGEELGANQFLKPIKYDESLLKKGGDSKIVYSVEKYNKNPTLNNAHNAQSDLNKIFSKYSKSPTGTLERDKADLALALKNDLLMKIRTAMNKTENIPHAANENPGTGLFNEYQSTREGYARDLGPYLNSPTVKRIIKKTPSIRDEKAADKLLREEDFMATAGQNHPDLLRREIFNNLKKNKALGITVGVGAGLGLLPEFLSKLGG